MSVRVGGLGRSCWVLLRVGGWKSRRDEAWRWGFPRVEVFRDGGCRVESDLEGIVSLVAVTVGRQAEGAYWEAEVR